MFISDVFPRIDIGGGFILREPQMTRKDAENHWICYSDPLVNRFIPDDCIPSSIQMATDDMRRFRDIFKSKQGILWMLSRKDTDEIVGNIGFHKCDWYHNRVELSYELRSDYWRRGIMSAATKAVIDYAFNKMSCHRIEATTVTNNIPSMSLLVKMGFVHEGTLSEYKFYKGKFVDINIFGYPVTKYRRNLMKLSDMKLSQNDESQVPHQRIAAMSYHYGNHKPMINPQYQQIINE